MFTFNLRLSHYSQIYLVCVNLVTKSIFRLMNLSIKLIFFLCLVLFSVSSCQKMMYEVQVVNNTQFNIDEMNLTWCQSQNRISINANDSSKVYVVPYQTSWANAFGPGELCPTIYAYSDVQNPETKIYNSCGNVISRDKLSTKKLNVVTITLDQRRRLQRCETAIFNCTLEVVR